MRSNSASKILCLNMISERMMIRRVRRHNIKYLGKRCSLTFGTVHETKPIAHHYNHRAEKPNKGQPQRGRKLQFEDFEWYERYAREDQFDGIPGKVEGRREHQRLLTQEQRLGNVKEDDGHLKHRNFPDMGHMHSPRHHRSCRNQEYRSS